MTSESRWPEIEKLLAASSRATARFVADPSRAADALEKLQLPPTTWLGNFARHCGGLLVDEWVRVLGSGADEFRSSLLTWNGFGEAESPGLAGAFVVAFDAGGGVFALDGGAFRKQRGAVFYFAPDSLRWEHVADGYGGFLAFLLTGDIDGFYENMRWPDWRSEAAKLGFDQAFSLYPPPWASEGKDLSKVSRRRIRAGEVFSLELDFKRQLDG